MLSEGAKIFRDALQKNFDDILGGPGLYENSYVEYIKWLNLAVIAYEGGAENTQNNDDHECTGDDRCLTCYWRNQ
jgi:hypothetical protein